MDIMEFFTRCDFLLAMPALLLFFSTGLFLTIKTRFAQMRNFSHFFYLLTHKENQQDQIQGEKTVNPIQAMIAAMATTIGMGNIVGPSIAIMIGGPGALFWLVTYSFFGSIMKFAETTFSVTFRKYLSDGTVLAGPTQYLREVHPAVGAIYAACTIFLFAGWSGLQANTLASMCALEGIAPWKTGFVIGMLVFGVIIGGITRISALTSRAVPLMFALYFFMALSILLRNMHAIIPALHMVLAHAFKPAAAVGGFAGASLLIAIKNGVQRNIYITEAGLGTSSVAHGMTDTKVARNQAILAMYSIIADTVVSFCSGLLVLVTGTWMTGEINNTVMYELFKSNIPASLSWLVLLCVNLFVITTVIGNSFNALQSYSYFARLRGKITFSLFLSIVIFFGAQMYVPLIWKLMDVIMVLVAIIHLFGLLVLSVRHGHLLKD